MPPHANEGSLFAPQSLRFINTSFNFRSHRKKGVKARRRPAAPILCEQPPAGKPEEFPPPGGLGQRPRLHGGWCQKSPWAQLATQRPGFHLGLGPPLSDSPTNTAGAPFNLLPCSLASLTSPENSRPCLPPRALACVLHVPAALAQVGSGSA